MPILIDRVVEAAVYSSNRMHPGNESETAKSERTAAAQLIRTTNFARKRIARRVEVHYCLISLVVPEYGKAKAISRVRHDVTLITMRIIT